MLIKVPTKQLEPTMTRHDPELIKAHALSRAAIDRSLSYDRARLSAVSLSHDEQIALASYIIDHLNGVDPDDRNAAVDAIGLLA